MFCQGVTSGSHPAKRKIGRRSGSPSAGRAINALDTVPYPSDRKRMAAVAGSPGGARVLPSSDYHADQSS